MKKLLLILALITLSALAFAQTGMFGLSFGQSMDTVISTLKAKGFTVTVKESDHVGVINPGIKGLKSMDLFFYNKNLSSWSVNYNTKNQPDLKSQILKELEKLHGTKKIWDDLLEDWGWELYDHRAVYLKEDREDNLLIVEYGFWKEWFGSDDVEYD